MNNIQEFIEDLKKDMDYLHGKRSGCASFRVNSVWTLIDAYEELCQVLEDIDNDAMKPINGHDALCMLGVIRSRIYQVLKEEK